MFYANVGKNDYMSAQSLFLKLTNKFSSLLSHSLLFNGNIMTSNFPS